MRGFVVFSTTLIGLLGLHAPAGAQTWQKWDFDPSGWWIDVKLFPVYTSWWPAPPGLKKVSGTNERFRSSALLNPPGGGPPPGVTAWVDHITLKMGLDTLDMPPPSPSAQFYYKEIRYATNHFANGPRMIEFKVHWIVQDLNLRVTREHDTDVWVQVDVYNKAVATGTENNAGIPQDMLDFIQEYGLQFLLTSEQSKVEAQAAQFELGQMFHQVVSGNHALTKSELALYFPDRTAWFASTHGDEDGIFDGTPAPGDYMPWTWISPLVNAGRDFPPFNVVAIYACDTVSGGPGAQQAFGLTGTHNQAYLGFNVAISAFLIPFNRDPMGGWLECLDWSKDPPVKGRLNDHVSRLFSKLRAGSTVNVSLNATTGVNELPQPEWGANFAFPPRSTSRAVADMYCLGDGAARLNSVYRNLTEEGTFPGNDRWYIVYTPPS